MKYILPLILFIFVSCISEVEYPEQKPVIDGWIDSNGFPVVIFTTSFNPESSENLVSDLVIKWGKVTISDGEETIILTGGPDNNVFPPYRYTTSQMKGEPGKVYTITADYKDLHAEAICEMPAPVPISDIKISPLDNTDSLFSAELSFITPEVTPAYFYITMKNMADLGRSLPAVLGTYRSLQPSREVTIPLYRPKNQLSEDPYVSQFKLGEKYEISLCRISEEVYEFWKGYDNVVLFGNSQFFDASNSIKGNIEGGYGIWSAQGVSKTLLSIE